MSSKKFLILTAVLLLMPFVNYAPKALAANPDDAIRYQKEAEYYQRQAESYLRDAEYYLRQAKSAESDAAYHIRNKNHDRARNFYRRAADYMDTYQTKVRYAKDAAERAEDYLRKATRALQ